MKYLTNRNEISHGLRQSNIFSFHCRKGNLSLQTGVPKDRTTKGQDDIASVTAGTVGVLGVLMTIKTSKVHVLVAIHTGYGRRGHNEPFILDTFQIVPNPNEGQFIAMGRMECIMITLLDSKGYVRMRVITKV